ncbi:DUF6884 domain-containing protein [Marinicella gelatinilytica]|uniref:DUF6884 domain-containing protein n=1 Tax=Marinicella gelatinilytica TaxID=2996017 RepID=UPI002260C803|nr:DUF6884 domain-containing protein [Marinicella gelatinilytica]MCX7546219.1 hypothetical protein [Marinicella gelatinilytica]
MKKIVIQCAGTKNPCGSFVDKVGKLVKFVAQPELCQSNEKFNFQKPDGLDSDGISWRDKLITYNKTQYKENPLKFLKAYELYKPAAYKGLVDKFGIENVYILSAGWGLVNADYLLPDYDITFSSTKKKDKYKKRKVLDYFNDFNFIDSNNNDEIIFLGGKSYQRLFVKLTNHLSSKKVIVYNSDKMPNFDQIKSEKFTKLGKSGKRLNMNWQYECAKEIINEKFKI